MAGINPIPSKVIDYNVYNTLNGLEILIGIGSECAMPDFESMSETVSGAGIAGEYESPTPGHFQSLSIEIPFMNVGSHMFSIVKDDMADITLRAATQYDDVSAGKIIKKGIRVHIRGIVKGFKTGTLSKAKPSGSSVTIEILYFYFEEDGKPLIELDKLNYVYSICGVDKLKQIRELI